VGYSTHLVEWGVTVILVTTAGKVGSEAARLLTEREMHSAARVGVGHVVKATSKAPADSPIARRRWHNEIEAGLAASRLPHTLLRSNAYMQNVLALAPAIAATSGSALTLAATAARRAR